MSPSSPSTNHGGSMSGVHRRRPSLLVTTPSSMDVPGLAAASPSQQQQQPSLSTSTSLHSNSSGSIVLASSPQAYTPTTPGGGGGGGSQLTPVGAGSGGARRRRASTTERSGEGAGVVVPSLSTSPSSSGGLANRAKQRSARRSSGHSEHLSSPQPYLATLAGTPVSPSPAETAEPPSLSGSAGLLGSPVNLLGLQHQQALKPYFPSPPPSLSRPPPPPPPPTSAGPSLRTLPASSARPILRTIASTSTAVYHPPLSSSPVRGADSLVPLSPGSGYLPSHAGRGALSSTTTGGSSTQASTTTTTAYDSEGSTSSNLPPYSLTPTGPSSSIRLPALPSLKLSGSAGGSTSGGPLSGFNTAYQTAQTSPSLALSLQMESEPAYPGQSHFFDSTPSSPRPSTSTSGEADELDRLRSTALYTKAYPTASSSAFEKLLPTKDDMRETASEWRRWWKRRNSRSHGSRSFAGSVNGNGGGGGGGGIGFLSTSSAGDRKKRRKRAGTGVGGGSINVGGPSWWRRIKPRRKKGWLLAGLLVVVCLWSFVDWMFWVFNPDKVRIEYRPQCVSPHPSYHALSTLSPDTLQRIALPSIGQPLHPLLPHPLLAPSSVESDALAPAGVFIGVFSTDSAFERRMLIRSTWASGDVWRGKQGEGLGSTRVRFILGKPKSGWEELVRIEMETYGDIVILEVPENMNSGKTHDYFSWASDNAMVPDVGPSGGAERKPDYVVKSDDDSFIMLGELEKRLRVLRGRKVYWGYLIKNLFMGGECYALSLDLVHYVATSAPIRQIVRGAEDKLVARWMRMHPEKETILWASESCWVYDHPRAGTVYSHGFLFPSTAREIQQELLTLGTSGGGAANNGPGGHTGKAANGTTTDKGRKRADSLSYTSVSQFRTKYRPPLPNLTPLQRVEALVEGSEMSLLSPYSSVPDTSPLLPETVMARRPSINDRYLGQWAAGRWGAGTVVVHYVKEREWFLETALAFERLGGGMGDEDYPVREGRKVETVREVQHVSGVDTPEDKETLLKRSAATFLPSNVGGEEDEPSAAVVDNALPA